MQELKGKGTCFHSEYYSLNNSPYERFCNSSIPVSSSDAGHRLNFVVPSHGYWFACMTGLKPCINLASTTDLWILVNLLPQVYYFSGGGGGWEHYLSQRDIPKSLWAVLIPALLREGLARLTDFRTAALIKENQNYKELGRLIDGDIFKLEKAICHLTDSLVQVFLQFRIGLNLLCLQQGGLYMTLGKQCYLCANHSGVIRYKEKTGKKQNRFSNWFESHVSWSLWLTSYVSMLMCNLNIIWCVFGLSSIFCNYLHLKSSKHLKLLFV